MSAQEIDTYMNKKSGMSESPREQRFSRSFAATKQGNERAALARKMFCKGSPVYRRLCSDARRRGCHRNDRGSCRNDGYIREMILQGLEYLGVDMDWI